MKESEIRPQALFDEYLRLAAIDAEEFFPPDRRIPILCPACRDKGKRTFVKAGFAYEQCQKCLTFYVSPRPALENFHRYYKEAPSVEFWATNFYKETSEARRKKIWKPKAEKLLKILTDNNATHHTVVDIGGGYGIFAEELKQLGHESIVIIEPGPLLAEVCRAKGLDVLEKFLEEVEELELPSRPKVFVSFELFEHFHDPEKFCLDVYKLMGKDDLLIFTTLSGTGADIQVLWERSKSVSPPHHLNFFNPYSIKLILERTGFDRILVTTPGQLDMDILSTNFKLIKDRFWQTVLQQADGDKLQRWQSFLVENNLSSHMMVICKAKK